jgi:hypothetical protein
LPAPLQLFAQSSLKAIQLEEIPVISSPIAGLPEMSCDFGTSGITIKQFKILREELMNGCG